MKKLFVGLFLLSFQYACSTTQVAEVAVPEISLKLDKTTPASVVQDGVEATFLEADIDVKEYKEQRIVDNSFVNSIPNMIVGTNIMKVETNTIYHPVTRNLKFRVKVKNNMDRPLRLNGAIVSIEMADKAISTQATNMTMPKILTFTPKITSQSLRDFLTTPRASKTQDEEDGKIGTPRSNEEDSKEISRIVILPGKEKDLEFNAPDYINIPENTTFTVNLFDVATRYDAASNPTQKKSWTWLAHYSRKNVKKSSERIIESKNIVRGPKTQIDDDGTIYNL